MFEMNMVFFALAIPAVIFAAVSKAGFGSGASFAATPILALILPPGPAIGVMLPLLMLMDMASLKPYWKKWDATQAKMLILGAVPGVALGALLYKSTNPDVFRLLIGLIAVGFVIYQMVLKSGLLRLRSGGFSNPMGGVFGMVTGFTSFVSHAGGPPATIYLLASQPSKTTYQATTVIVFWAVNVMKFVPYAFLGIFTTQTLLADLVLAPFAVAGAWLGVKAHHLVPERAFFALTYVLLTLTGSKLIWDALT
ncbi:hypothetical protein ATO10_11907 [Actibacterium atlanticum]|uniref:Probable membrane transporter protein n=1 Tax=Actibacterium atlanticum TaxID=1461693 RepID=A0A058ZLE7_9RHOB|nr:sulfite exporter TauE/SafE family protein [Actibacterium atlanticum]KCV81616.1 hypothetical protein ATO10_11907 [Actibacterium atlanticum]